MRDWPSRTWAAFTEVEEAVLKAVRVDEFKDIGERSTRFNQHTSQRDGYGIHVDGFKNRSLLPIRVYRTIPSCSPRMVSYR